MMWSALDVTHFGPKIADFEPTIENRRCCGTAPMLTQLYSFECSAKSQRRPCVGRYRLYPATSRQGLREEKGAGIAPRFLMHLLSD